MVIIGIPLINKTISTELLLFKEYLTCLTIEKIFFLNNSFVSGFNPLLGSKYIVSKNVPLSLIPFLKTSTTPLLSISSESLFNIFSVSDPYWSFNFS